MGKTREYLPKKDRDYIPLCDNEIIAKLWDCEKENIRLEYQANKNKQQEYKMLDMGAFCITNGISPQMLEMFARFGKEFAETFSGITKEQIEEFKKFQQFMLFQENK